MSLINQVLQDLDRRRVGAASPVAPVGVAAARRDARAPRWLVAVAIATTAAALGLALTLSGAFASVAVRVAPSAPVPPSLALTAAPSAMPAPTMIASAPVAAAAVVAAPAPIAAPTPVAAPAPVNAVASAATPATAVVAHTSVQERSAATTETPTSATVASKATAHASVASPIDDARTAPAERVAVATPPQLDKRTPPATARERAEAAYRRGLEAHRDGRDDDAEAAFGLAMQEDPRHAAARQALAVTLAGRQRGDAAEALLVEGLALDARQPLLATTLARIKAGRGDVAGAIAVLDGQDSAPAQALRATLLQSAGRHREAIEHYALALQLAPANGAWWAGMSVSLAAVGRYETAREALLRARGSESTTPELLAWIEQRLRSGTHVVTAPN